jgi:hypothetical protein
MKDGNSVPSPSRDEEQIALDRDALPPPDGEITALAYQLWTKRGCPIGSPDDDWFQAEAELKNKVQAEAATA